MQERPSLVLSEAPSYSTPFYADPWPLDGDSPSSEKSQSEPDCYGPSTRSSRTSSSCSHVLPEYAFQLGGAGDGGYLVDPYFGQKDLALLCSAYLIKSFKCHEETEASRQLGQPKLSMFIAQLIHITGVPLKVVIAALILLQRFHSSLPANNMSFSGHRLFIGALMLACNDESVQGMVRNARSAAYWSEISLFTESELDDIFNDLYDKLDGNVVVFPSYAAALEKLNNPVSIKAFERDLDFFSSDCDSDSHSQSSFSVASSIRDEKVSPGGKRQTPSAIRKRVASFFGRKSLKS